MRGQARVRKVTEDDSAGATATASARVTLDHLFAVTYEELRRLASSIIRNSDFDSTSLVNEAWLKLAHSHQLAAASPLHFKRIAARAMRQVLVEGERRRSASKRGGTDAVLVTMDGEIAKPDSHGEVLIAVEQALQELQRLEPRQAVVVKCRFFGGLDIRETAALLGLSEATVNREWRLARTWLKQRLAGQVGKTNRCANPNCLSTL